MQQYASFLQWAAQNGMLGIYAKWSNGENWYLEGAKYWILRQLFMNPYQDVDLLWRQYCDDMYGAGSEPMFRLFRHFADKYVYSDRYIVRADMARQEMALFTQEDLDYQRSLIEKANALTRDDAVVQERLGHFLRYFRAHELFSQAVGEIARLDRRFGGEGINKAALAFYVNDTGQKLREAVEYYQAKRTIPPDIESDKFAAVMDSYIANYSRAMGKILLAVHKQAALKVPLEGALTPARVKEFVAECKRVFRGSLPGQYDEQRARGIEALLEKTLWIPTVKEMPKIDGDLSDAVWKKAAELRDCTVRDRLVASRHGTTGRVMRAGDHVVFGLECRQDGDIWARTTPDIHSGTRIWRESGCEFIFGPASRQEEKGGYVQYIVNALGAFRGFRAAKENREGCQVGVELDKEGGRYTIEFAMPLKAGGYDYTQEKVFTFNIMRNIFRADTFAAEEIIGWYPIFFTAHNPESRGLVFVD